MFNYTEEWSDAAVRRFLHRVGSEYVEDLLALRIADIYGMRRRLPKGAGVDRLRERIGRIQERKNALSLADLAVDGNELQEAGIPRGPAIGSTLRFLLETVLEDPELNERDTLIEIATRFYHERLSPLQEDGNVSEK
jgi:poly(A) polymerase/tRNA nucleotidyltransferase (CCA-adding enzyme)